MPKGKHDKAREEKPVELCFDCRLPLCPHGKCINDRCPQYSWCTCLDKYRFKEEKKR